jgi:hypothetical protein
VYFTIILHAREICFKGCLFSNKKTVVYILRRVSVMNNTLQINICRSEKKLMLHIVAISITSAPGARDAELRTP